MVEKSISVSVEDINPKDKQQFEFTLKMSLEDATKLFEVANCVSAEDIHRGLKIPKEEMEDFLWRLYRALKPFDNLM